jgi:hypothetical protein
VSRLIGPDQTVIWPQILEENAAQELELTMANATLGSSYTLGPPSRDKQVQRSAATECQQPFCVARCGKFLAASGPQSVAPVVGCTGLNSSKNMAPFHVLSPFDPDDPDDPDDPQRGCLCLKIPVEAVCSCDVSTNLVLCMCLKTQASKLHTKSEFSSLFLVGFDELTCSVRSIQYAPQWCLFVRLVGKNGDVISDWTYMCAFYGEIPDLPAHMQGGI